MIDFQNLNENALKQLGIAFCDSDEAKTFADFVLEELDVNIGRSISDGMSQELLDEFDAISDQEELVRWLNKNKPDYQDIVKQEQVLMAWNLLKYRKRVSTSYNRKEIDMVHCHIQALELKPDIYNCLCNAHLYFISDILDLDCFERISGLDDAQKNEIKTQIVNFLVSKHGS